MSIKWVGDKKQEVKSSQKDPWAVQRTIKAAGGLVWKNKPTVKPKVITRGITKHDLKLKNISTLRPHVYAGALCRLAKTYAKVYDAKYCTVLSPYEGYQPTFETKKHGAYWEVLMPNGSQLVISSTHLLPLTEIQNGNVAEEDEDEGAE